MFGCAGTRGQMMWCSASLTVEFATRRLYGRGILSEMSSTPSFLGERPSFVLIVAC